MNVEGIGIFIILDLLICNFSVSVRYCFTWFSHVKFILGHFEMFAAKVAFSTILSNCLLLAYIKEIAFHVFI